jgi:hypothetical protein
MKRKGSTNPVGPLLDSALDTSSTVTEELDRKQVDVVGERLVLVLRFIEVG